MGTPGWGQRLFPAMALALFLLHAVLFVAAPSNSASSLISNLIQFACSLLATLSALYAARRMSGFGKHFWLLSAAGFFVWTVAQAVATYCDSILHLALQQPWPSDVIFFLSMAPLMMTLFIHSERGLEWRDWPRVLDLVQVVILMVAAFLFIFAEPAHWKMNGGVLARLSWLPNSGRDLLLTVAFSFRALFSRRNLGRDLYARLAVFSGVYFSCEVPYLYLQAEKNLQSGTPWELCWSFPFVVATILAATSKPRTESPRDEVVSQRKDETWSGWGLVVHILPMTIPLVVLLMAAGVAEKQLSLAISMVLASFACSSARIMFSERQRQQADSALEEKSALLRSIFEGSGDNISVKDLEGRYLYVNQSLAKIYRSTPELIIGKRAEDYNDLVTARLLSEHDRLVISSGQTKAFEYRIAVGQTSFFLTTKSPVRDSSGKIIGVITISRDITEHRAMEDRLRQAQKMEAIGTLAGGVAHDFNNLLMVISGYSAVLSDALAAEPKLRTHVDHIQKAGERAAALTRQLLAFSRKQPVQPVPLNLNQVVSGIEKLLHRLIGEHIIISTNLASGLGTAFADAGQIEQVILNLAINARDAMPNGGRLTLETKNIEMTDVVSGTKNLKPGPCVELAVSDTGVGMDVQVQAHIFEPFFTTKPLGKGTGLGLSTVYGIVHQAKGYITFTSQPGAGTTFRVYLPRIDKPQQPLEIPVEKELVLDGCEIILLVEDDASVCELIRAVLTSHGYSVLSARDPHEAEVLCIQNSGRVDLLLSDVILPKMSGADLSARLLAHNPRLKVLFMSGYIDDSVVRQEIQEKELAFLQKPFSPLSLAKKVREVLDGLRVR